MMTSMLMSPLSLLARRRAHGKAASAGTAADLIETNPLCSLLYAIFEEPQASVPFRKSCDSRPPLIPSGCVAPPRRISLIRGRRRALPVGRIGGLDVHMIYETEH
jgi:hypothetical protein